VTPGALLPDDVALGPVRLRVADRSRTRAWLESVLGMDWLGDEGGRSRFGARGGAPLVEVREQPGARPIPRGGRPGIYHYALLLPERSLLGRFLRHLDAHGFGHADSDHLVSEAIYLVDPDGVTVEVYADRPRELWRHRGDEIAMATLPIDHDDLSLAGAGGAWAGLPPGTRMGHVHHHVGDLELAERFYVDGLGFGVTTRGYSGALFVAAAGYHHHVGLNTWAAARAPAGPEDAGLDEWTLVVPGASERFAVAQRLSGQGVPLASSPDAVRAADPWGIQVSVTARE